MTTCRGREGTRACLEKLPPKARARPSTAWTSGRVGSKCCDLSVNKPETGSTWEKKRSCSKKSTPRLCPPPGARPVGSPTPREAPATTQVRPGVTLARTLRLRESPLATLILLVLSPEAGDSAGLAQALPTTGHTRHAAVNPPSRRPSFQVDPEHVSACHAAQVHFRTLNSMFILTMAQDLDHCSFRVSITTGMYHPLTVLFKESFGCSKSLTFHMNFRISLSIFAIQTVGIWLGIG